jgi:hypothetical protein
MYQVTHESGIANQMVAERRAQADANRLAALSRGSRARRPSLVGRIGGHLAHMGAIIRHRPVTHDAARATRS